MAEAVQAANEGAAPKKKGKLLPIAALLLVVLAGGGGAAFFLGVFGGGEAEAAAEEGHDEGHGDAAQGDAAHGGDGHEAGPPAPAFVNLPDILVNLESTGKRMRFLKLRVALEVEGEARAEEITAMAPRVMDSFQLYLRSLAPEDIEGARGAQRLKEEMLARINLAIEPKRVSNVLIKEMLVQ